MYCIRLEENGDSADTCIECPFDRCKLESVALIHEERNNKICNLYDNGLSRWELVRMFKLKKRTIDWVLSRRKG
jgi:hypothetical protein